MADSRIKYTPSIVLKELEGMLKIAKEDNSIVYLGSLFKDKDYSMDTIRVVINRFKKKIENKKIIKDNGDYSKIKQIVQIKTKINEVVLEAYNK